MTNINDWIAKCAEEPEFVSRFNRLYGTKLVFDLPPRAPIEAMVDRVCDFDRFSHCNSHADLEAFFKHCVDLWIRISRLPTEVRG